MSHFPTNFDEYREPFVGGGGIFFSVPVSKKRWINDKDQNLMSVYFALKHRPEEFISMCKSIEPYFKGEALTFAKPGGKKLYCKRMKKKFDELLNNPDADPALKYFFVNRTVWAGRVNYNLESRLYFSNHNGWNVVKTDLLEKASRCLRDAKITVVDYKHVLRTSGKNCVIYLDPPYVKESQMSTSSRLYLHSFNINDHIELLQEIQDSNHVIILSYEDNELIRDLYSSSDFRIYEFDHTYCGTNSAMSLSQNVSRKKRRAVELIITRR